MSFSWAWMTVSCCTAVIALAALVPRRRSREAWVSFLLTQTMTWLVGTWLADKGWVQAPVRLFDYATRANFVADFFLYPSLAVLYYFYFPFERELRIKMAYTLAGTAAVTLWAAAMERWTLLERYIHWNAAYEFAFVALFLVASCLGTKWFFREPLPAGLPSQVRSCYGRQPLD